MRTVKDYDREKVFYYESECSAINRGRISNDTDICEDCIHNNIYMTKSGVFYRACTLKSDFDSIFFKE